MSDAIRTEDVTHFSAAAEWTGVRAEEREAWLAMRKTLLTAGDMAAVLGEDEHRTAIEVYIEKLATQTENPVLGLEDPRFWGSTLEQPILRAVATYRGWKYWEGGALLRSRKHPFIGATLDAEVDRGDGVWIDLEGKTTRLPRGWDEETGELPTRVLIQVQTQLLVTGAPLAIVFALLQGSRPVQIPVEPSLKFHAVLVERAEEFIEMVRAGTPPLPTGTRMAGRALAKLYPRENGEAVMLPDEAIDWTRKIQQFAAEKRMADNRLRYYQQLLKHSIGPATYGVLPEEVGGKRCWRWQVQETPAHEVETYESRVLLSLKLPPGGKISKALPQAKDDSLVPKLEESIAREDLPKIRYGQGRKRARR